MASSTWPAASSSFGDVSATHSSDDNSNRAASSAQDFMGLAHHLDRGAVNHGLRIVGAEGHCGIVGKARRDLNASEILQRDVNFLALQLVVDDLENIRTGIVDTNRVAW